MDKINKVAKMLMGEVPLGREGEYYDYNLLPDLEAFNRADTVNMNDEEMNKFRHIAGSKQALNDLGFPRGLAALLYKEGKDLKNGDGWEDTKYDLKNDLEAVKLYFNNFGLDGDNLYNYTFQNYIKPNR